jgi:hypothetical protein
MLTMRCLLAACAATAVAQSPAFAVWTWTPLDYPGALWTYADGVSGDTIVGTYAGDGGIHGFSYNGTDWRALDYPGAYLTYACGVWDDHIVGWYTPPGGGFSEYGFLYDGATWTSLRYPSAIQTRALGVFEDRIVGYYIDSSYRQHGFLFDGRQPSGQQWTKLDYPAGYGTETLAFGIWGNTVVGAYDKTGLYARGFIYDGNGIHDPNSWTSVSAPVPGRGTVLVGISGGTLLGNLHLSGGDATHFLIDGSTWTFFNSPLGGSWVNAISGDRIVGTYADAAGQHHGFLLTTPEPASLALLAFGGLLIAPRRRS